MVGSRCMLTGALLASFLLWRPGQASVAAQAQQGSATAGQQSESPVATYRTNANLVLVDVVVRDKGKPLEGLAKSAFHIAEDGHDEKISVFEEHRATDAVEAKKHPPLPPHVYTNAPQYTLTSAANVLLLDALNTQRPDLRWVQERALKYLQTIPRGTQIAVFTLGSRLRMVAGFTTGAGTIVKALNATPGRAERPVEADAAVNTATREVMGTLAAEAADNGGGGLAQMQAFTGETTRFEENQKIPILLGALEELGRYLSTMPGRKNLIWFTGGINNCLDRDSLEGQRACEPYIQQIEEVEDLLTWGRVALYPIDAGGLMTLPTSNATLHRHRAPVWRDL